MDKPILEQQTSMDFNTAKDGGGGSGTNKNSNMFKARSPTTFGFL